MSNEHEKDRLRRISYEAACWYVLCSDDPTSLLLEKRLEFAEWIRQSPDHVREILLISCMRKRMRRVRLLVRVAQIGNVIRFPRFARPFDYEAPKPFVPSRRRALRLALMAGVALVLVCDSTSVGPVHTQSFETQAREVKHELLPDGSVVHLSGSTKVAISFSGRERLLHLFEGEAVFEVAKDSARPFIVRTHLVDATALGTRYSVSIHEGVTTTVTEGVVKVARRGGSMDEGISVSAGQELYMRGGSDETSIRKSVDSERKLSWSVGWLVFRGETVEEAVSALNKFNVVQIVVDSEEIGKRRIQYHRARLNEPEEFAKVVAAWPDVLLTIDRGNNRLYLSRK